MRRHQRSGQRAAIWHVGRHVDCEALIWLLQRVPEKRRVRVYELPATRAKMKPPSKLIVSPGAGSKHMAIR